MTKENEELKQEMQKVAVLTEENLILKEEVKSLREELDTLYTSSLTQTLHPAAPSHPTETTTPTPPASTKKKLFGSKK